MSDANKESTHSASENQPSQPQQQMIQLKEQNDTIFDIHHSATSPPHKTTRPIPALIRNLSEMSIECSTTPSSLRPPPATVSTNAEPQLILDDMDGLSSSNKILIQEKVKSVFELPESESLVNEFPCYLIRLVTIPGWMYITNNHICFYASLPDKKKGPHKAGYLSKKNHITSPRTYRYYFELQNHVLSWYSSAETKYLPLNSVDLKCVTKIEPSRLKKYGIRLSTTDSHHYTIVADSELSQREWMDELRKGVFVAQHAGNSVRIVLPFSKITIVEKPAVFQFAANINIKFMDDINEGEDYYFAFFPDIEMAYNEIMNTWKNHVPRAVVLLENGGGEKKRPQSMPSATTKTSNTNNSSFLSFDSFLENISSAALPTMLLGKLMNVTSLFQSNNNGTTATSTSANHQHHEEEEEEDEEDELLSDNNEYEPDDVNTTNNQTSSLLSSIKIPLMMSSNNKANMTISPNKLPTSTSKKLKRNSLFFNKTTPESPVTESSPEDSSPAAAATAGDHTSSVSEESKSATTGPRSGTFNNLSKIPRAVSDAIKHQVLRTEDTSSAPQQRSRSKSLHTLRHHMSPFYLYNKMNKDNNTESTLPSVDTALTSTHSGDVSLISSSTTSLPPPHTNKTRSQRATSIGSMLLSGGSRTWHKLTPSTDYYLHQQHLNEHQHRHPKGPMWLNLKIAKELKEAEEEEEHDDLSSVDEEDNTSEEEEVVNIPASLDIEAHAVMEEDPHILEEEQQTMNEHLNNNFPMLLKTEVVEAAFKASFWRTIPYSGKIYITDRYFCFTSKILAGQQKLIVPWTDVIQVNKLKSKSYYLLHGITMVVKDMTDEIYFDFSSIKLRDNCFAVCQLKCENRTIFDASSIISRESKTGVSMSSIILDRPEHIVPPTEYDGPPLLSTSSSLSKPSKKYSPPENSLHFTCLTIGSRSDVQPYVALCKELQKDGHRCRISTHPEYEKWITQHGIEFRSIGGDPGELMKLCIDNSFLSVSFIREGTKFFYSWFEALLESAYEACKGTDCIIESPSAMVGVHMAEKLEIPYFRSMPFPFTRTTKFPHPFAMQSTAGGRIYNDMTYVMIDMALWAGTAKYVNRFRRDVLELPSTSLDRLELWKIPYIYSFSPTVVHPPKDWPDYIHCTGYWFLDNPDQSWKADPALLKFLNNEEDKRPIVYIGFGSIIVPDAVETTHIIVEAVLKSGVKAIICKGWSTRPTAITGKESAHSDDEQVLLDLYPDTIYHIDAVPHDWLFPQIQGVVHHGGAGTTAAGLRAGLPTVIKPFFGDQRFWGQRLEELQVGLCINKLSKNQLADALITITQNKAMIAKAQSIGDTIRKEHGPRHAIESIYREFEFAKEQRMNT